MNLNFNVKKIVLIQIFLLLIVFAGNAQPKVDTANNNIASPPQEELTSTNTEPKESNLNWPLIMLIPAFVIGAGLGYYFSRKKAGGSSVAEVNETENESQSKTGKKELSNQNKLLKTAQNKISELEDSNRSLHAKYDQLSDEHTDMLYFDKEYFGACDKKIVAPFWDAVNNKNEKSAIENALKSVAQLTAISRLKLNIQQSFDEYNINEMMDKSTGNNCKVIDGNTNKDIIPDNINTIISIMKKNNIGGLGNNNFQGYTLNNLDS